MTPGRHRPSVAWKQWQVFLHGGGVEIIAHLGHLRYPSEVTIVMSSSCFPYRLQGGREGGGSCEPSSAARCYQARAEWHHLRPVPPAEGKAFSVKKSHLDADHFNLRGREKSEIFLFFKPRMFFNACFLLNSVFVSWSLSQRSRREVASSLQGHIETNNHQLSHTTQDFPVHLTPHSGCF